jgi:hypothetical protein
MTRKCLRHIVLFKSGAVHSWSQWPRSLKHVSAAARLPGLRIRILPGAWLCDSCECCVLSGRGHWVRLITRPEESYKMCCVRRWSWSLDNEDLWPTRGYCAMKKRKDCTQAYTRMWFTLSRNKSLRMKGKTFLELFRWTHVPIQHVTGITEIDSQVINKLISTRRKKTCRLARNMTV